MSEMVHISWLIPAFVLGVFVGSIAQMVRDHRWFRRVIASGDSEGA